MSYPAASDTVVDVHITHNVTQSTTQSRCNGDSRATFTVFTAQHTQTHTFIWVHQPWAELLLQNIKKYAKVKQIKTQTKMQTQFKNAKKQIEIILYVRSEASSYTAI